MQNAEVFTAKGKSGQVFEYKKGKTGDLVMRYGHPDTIGMGMAYVFPASLYRDAKVARAAGWIWLGGFPTCGERARKQILDFLETFYK